MVEIRLGNESCAIPTILWPDVHPPANLAPNPTRIPPANNIIYFKYPGKIVAIIVKPLSKLKVRSFDKAIEINPPVTSPITNRKRQSNLFLKASFSKNFIPFVGKVILHRFTHPEDTPRGLPVKTKKRKINKPMAAPPAHQGHMSIKIVLNILTDLLIVMRDA